MSNGTQGLAHVISVWISYARTNPNWLYFIYRNWKYTYMRFNLAFNTHPNPNPEFTMSCGMWPIGDHVVFYFISYNCTNIYIYCIHWEKTPYNLGHSKKTGFFSSCSSRCRRDSLNVAVVVFDDMPVFGVFSYHNDIETCEFWMKLLFHFAGVWKSEFFTWVNLKITNKRTDVSSQTIRLSLKPNRDPTKIDKLFDSACKCININQIRDLNSRIFPIQSVLSAL